MQFGYTAMCEQTPVKQLVRDLQASEQAGFDFSVVSDHYFPWLEEQGHSGYTWAVLGAAAQATDRLPIMTMVTCPTFRYHPAVVAQKAATVGVLSDGRFTLGLGAGENLNEHVIGTGWPAVRVRHERLEEAAQISRFGSWPDASRADPESTWILPSSRKPLSSSVSRRGFPPVPAASARISSSGAASRTPATTSATAISPSGPSRIRAAPACSR
jgi:Luciferase-like monooxygenase